MAVFKSLQHIFNNPWEDELDNNPSKAKFLPPKSTWDKEKKPTLKDINLWEQIYYKPGSIGIYAAWDPYVEYFIIVHNLYINTTFGIEEFKGHDAETNVKSRAKEFNIVLSPS